MENQEIPGRIQMELFIPVEIFRKKGNTFRGITFFPFLLKRLKFVVPLVWIISAMLQVERKRKNLPVFCKWYNSIPFLFSVPQKIPVPFDGNFSPKFPLALKDHNDYEIFSILSCDRAWTSVILAGKRDSRLHSTRSFSENVVVAEQVIKF